MVYKYPNWMTVHFQWCVTRVLNDTILLVIIIVLVKNVVDDLSFMPDDSDDNYIWKLAFHSTCYYFSATLLDYEIDYK